MDADMDMEFVCPSIKRYLRECRDQVCEQRHFEMAVGSVPCAVALRVCVSRSCTAPFDLRSVLEYAEMVTRWVGSRAWSRPIEHLDITIWLTPLRKYWCPTDRSPSVVHNIGICEVNSGETHFLHRRSRRIKIWRAEDWSKVLIHELLHSFDWDRLVPSTTDNQSEAFVESMATLMHVQLMGGPDWKRVLTSQRRWMLQQATQLLLHSWKPAKTSVRSYYIVKTALLQDDRALAMFAHWVRQPDEQTCRRTWPQLVSNCLAELMSRLGQPQQGDTGLVSRLREPQQAGAGRNRHRAPYGGDVGAAHVGCIPMRMVEKQLALAPQPVRAT